MDQSDLYQFLATYALYAINVYGPASEETVVELVAAARKFEKLKRKRLSESVHVAIGQLVEQHYVGLTRRGEYYATFAGIHVLSRRKLGYPRDTNRLYFLKNLLKGRGK